MNCNCSQYHPLELDRASIDQRIKVTEEIVNALTLVAENIGLWLLLLKCPTCGQYWQTGHEWSFKDQDYVFQVPATEAAEWLAEPYAQPAALMIYTASMSNFYEQNSFETGLNQCRVAGCHEKAIKFSAVCRQHHIAQLQNAGLLPEPPAGRLFPPYL